MAVRDRFGADSRGWRERRARKGVPREGTECADSPEWSAHLQSVRGRTGTEVCGQVGSLAGKGTRKGLGMTCQGVQRTWKALRNDGGVLSGERAGSWLRFRSQEEGVLGRWLLSGPGEK